MLKPKSRNDLPVRMSENNKRKIAGVEEAEQARLLRTIKYEGHSKHKRNPHRFGLEPFRGIRSDETFCDETAGFEPEDMGQTTILLHRAVRSGMMGRQMLWGVAASGWIFEFRPTNIAQDSFHGYPMLPSDPFAELVWRAFTTWADVSGTQDDKLSAQACKRFYGFRA